MTTSRPNHRFLGEVLTSFSIRRAGAVLAALALMLTLAAPGATASRATAPSGDRLIIPRLDLNAPLGTRVNAGPAFYPGSGRPGEPYTIAIAGHRTTHTRPFWSLDVLSRGDRIVIVSRGVRHAYRVTGTRVVAPSDWSIVRERGYERVVLTTCTPRFSARQRLAVFARIAG